MANIAANAILTAVRDVIEDNAGSLRKVAAARFDGGLYESLDDTEKSRRAVDTPIAEATITNVERNEASPPINGTFTLYNVDVEIRIIRHLNVADRVNDATRDSAKALAVVDGDILRQALMWPGNLTSDNASNATGLASGMMSEYVGSAIGRIDLEDEGPGLLETIHTFRGIVNVTLAIS